MIRPATPADAAAVLALWSAAGSVPSVSDDEASIVALLERDPGALLCAVDPGTGEIVGSVIAAYDGWRGAFYRLAVRPDRRRGGIARALVAAGEARLAGLGVRRAAAIVMGGHDHATGFWEAAGYAWDQRVRRYTRVLGSAAAAAGGAASDADDPGC